MPDDIDRNAFRDFERSALSSVEAVGLSVEFLQLVQERNEPGRTPTGSLECTGVLGSTIPQSLPLRAHEVIE